MSPYLYLMNTWCAVLCCVLRAACHVLCPADVASGSDASGDLTRLLSAATRARADAAAGKNTAAVSTEQLARLLKRGGAAGGGERPVLQAPPPPAAAGKTPDSLKVCLCVQDGWLCVQDGGGCMCQCVVLDEVVYAGRTLLRCYAVKHHQHPSSTPDTSTHTPNHTPLTLPHTPHTTHTTHTPTQHIPPSD